MSFTRCAPGLLAALLALNGVAVTADAVKLGHPDAVLTTAFSPDGKLLATGCEDGAVRLWKVADPRSPVAVLKHGGPVMKLAYSSDGKSLVSAAEAGSLKLWDIAKRTQIRTLAKLPSVPRELRLSPTGHQLMTATWDGVVRLHVVATGKLLRKFGIESFGAAAITPDWRTVLTAAGPRITLWDAATGRKLAALKGHPAAVHHLGVSPDGKRLASECDKKLVVWNLDKRTQLRAEAGWWSSSWGAEGKRLAVLSSDDRTVRVCTREGETLHSFRAPEVLGSVEISSDGRVVFAASEKGSTYAWNAATGASLATLKGDDERVMDPTLSVRARALTGLGAGGKTLLLHKLAWPRK